MHGNAPSQWDNSDDPNETINNPRVAAGQIHEFYLKQFAFFLGYCHRTQHTFVPAATTLGHLHELWLYHQYVRKIISARDEKYHDKYTYAKRAHETLEYIYAWFYTTYGGKDIHLLLITCEE